MEHGALVEPAPPIVPPPPADRSTGGDVEDATSLLGPFLFGAACGWILLSVVNLGELAFGLFGNIQLANALWLAYLQPALLLALTGCITIQRALRQRAARGSITQAGRFIAARTALALLIAWAPYLVVFALPHGILQLNTYREVTEPGNQRVLLFVQLALTPAAGWLTGLLAVFVWGRSGTRESGRRLGPVPARWLTVALVASLAFACCAELTLILGRLEDYILIAPVDPTCGGGCTGAFVVNRLLVPMLLSIVFGILGGIAGGFLRLGRVFPHGVGVQAERAEVAQPAEDAPRDDIAEVPPVVEGNRYRPLPGSTYWGPFLLGILTCGGWLMALYLSGDMPPMAPIWRIPAQIALLLVFPAGVILYSARRRRRPGEALPLQAIYALLAVVLSLAATLLEVILLTGPNAGGALLLPFFAPLVLPIFGPALSIGVAVGFAWGVAWGVRRPDARHPIARPGGIGAALCGWAGFALPLAGVMILVAVSLHSITCGSFGGCVLAGAIVLSIFASVSMVMLFGVVLILAGLAIGRVTARGLPPGMPLLLAQL